MAGNESGRNDARGFVELADIITPTIEYNHYRNSPCCYTDDLAHEKIQHDYSSPLCLLCYSKNAAVFAS